MGSILCYEGREGNVMMKPFICTDGCSSYIFITSPTCLLSVWLTFKHFHSHSGVTSFPFQPESCCLNNFSKLSFTQSLAKYKVFTRKLPLRILLFFLKKNKHLNYFFDFLTSSTNYAEERSRRKDNQLTGILKVSVSMDSCEPRRTLLAGKLMG